MSEEKLLTITEAAKVLNLKPGTLRKWDREGKIKPLRIGTRGDRRYKEAELLSLLDTKKDEKVRWQEYLRNNAPFHIAEPVVVAFQKMKKHFGRRINHLITYYQGDTLAWCYNMQDLYDAGRAVVDTLTKSKNKERWFFEEWDKKADKIIKLIEKYPIPKLQKLSGEKIADIYEKYQNLLADWYGLAIAIDATDETLMLDISKELKDLVKNKLGNKFTEKKFIDAYGALTNPSHLSYVNNERKMVLEIARSVKAKKLKMDSPEFKKKIQEIAKKFWWSSLGWGRLSVKTPEDIKMNVEEIITTNTDMGAEIKKIKNYNKEIRAQKEKTEKEFAISKNKELSSWLMIMDKLFEYHDRRKEMQVKGVYWEYRLFDLIAERKHIPTRLFDWAKPSEIISFLRGGKFDQDEMNQRSFHFIWLTSNGKEESITGREAIKKHAEFFDAVNEETRDLNGITASGGKAVGEAFVAIAYEKASQIKPGQVLVTGMTTPEFVPVMRKASAVVTDEGGITCHAAIISRELGIPCIVGTKIATKIIKSGDRIEVAANHGVVRILSK